MAGNLRQLFTGDNKGICSFGLRTVLNGKKEIAIIYFVYLHRYVKTSSTNRKTCCRETIRYVYYFSLFKCFSKLTTIKLQSLVSSFHPIHIVYA